LRLPFAWPLFNNGPNQIGGLRALIKVNVMLGGGSGAFNGWRAVATNKRWCCEKRSDDKFGEVSHGPQDDKVLREIAC